MELASLLLLRQVLGVMRAGCAIKEEEEKEVDDVIQ